ncbi:unnamed protein product [Dibothriocephalus latus]|uniref:Uncharacterized protein n=1 Tax=Dibothriocephalus latus TaxID=60516 RepID=A0A3P6TA24_DIBLA|nr:unnamed protein product [Dibothriocephalus latus]
MIQQYHQPMYRRRQVPSNTQANLAETATPATYDNKISRSAFVPAWKNPTGGHRSPYYGNGLVSSAHSSFTPFRWAPPPRRPVPYSGRNSILNFDLTLNMAFTRWMEVLVNMCHPLYIRKMRLPTLKGSPEIMRWVGINPCLPSHIIILHSTTRTYAFPLAESPSGPSFC